MVDRNVTYRLKGDANDFTRVVNRAEATLSGSFRNMAKSSKTGGRAVAGDYNAIAKAAGGAQFKVKGLVTTIAGFALGGGGLAALGKSAISAADDIAKMANKLGLATDELQRYQFASEISGITTDQFNTAFQRFGRRLGEAAQGFGEARPAIKSLNISLREIDGTLRPVNQVFDEAIQKLSQIEDVTLRNALAAKLFDSEGVKLVQLGKNLAGLKQQAGDLGTIIPEYLLHNAEDLNDQLTILQKRLAVKLTAALIKFTPYFKALANGAGVLVDNFDEIISAIGTFAKLLIAIKLGSFIQTMFSVGYGAIAAASGLNALRVSLQGLKAATFVGLGLIALEIVIQKFLNSVDDSGKAVEQSLKDAEQAVADSTKKIAQSYSDVTSELVQKRNEYNGEIDKLVKAEVKSLEDGLKAQEAVVSKQKSLLDAATSDAKKAADEFKAAFDQLAGKNAKVENPNLIDFSKQITEARKLLAKGDNKGAVDAALRAKDVVLALQETGNYTEAQLSGTLKKAQQVQQAASAAIVTQQQSAVDQAQTALQKIQSEINLIKSISFSFDETKSLAEAKRVIDQIKTLIDKQPIVVPVELKPINGIDVSGATAPAPNTPGYARGGYIHGPGTTTSDSILARLSRGEYVLRANAVKKYGLDFLNQINAGRLPGYASGGLVQAPSGGSSGTPVNLNLGGRDYTMTTTPETASRLRRDTYIEQLKKGRRQ
jgi:hypothetical protein